MENHHHATENQPITKERPKSVALVGVYPPPYGGISVHIERLYHALKQRGIPCKVYDGSETAKEQLCDAKGQHHDMDIIPAVPIERWCWRYLWQQNEDVIHNHFLRWQIRFVLSLLKFKGKRIVHTLHSYRGDGKYSLPIRWMIRITGWLSDHFVVVNEEIKQKLLQHGISEQKISVIPAFIPPVEDPSVKLLTDITDFYAKHRHIILANGGVGNLHQGVDLYGLDLCVGLMERLRSKRSDVGLVYCITHIVDEAYLQTWKSRIHDLGLDDHILLVYEKMPLYPLIKPSALFVRPTNSDGDAISIREALHYRIPVVASDAAPRPKGTILFENRNLNDFLAKCERVLEQKNAPGSGPVVEHEPNQTVFLEQLLNILQSSDGATDATS